MRNTAQRAQHLREHLAQPPSRKMEDWRYVDFKFLQKNEYQLFESAQDNHIQVIDAEKKVVITLGSGDAQKWNWHGKVAGMQVRTSQNPQVSWDYQNFFSHLSKELQPSRTEIVFAKDFPADYVVEWHWPTTSTANIWSFHHVALSVVIEAGAQVKIVEKSILSAQNFLNLEVQYDLQKNSSLSLIKIENGQKEGRGCQTVRFNVQERAQLMVMTATAHATWSRHNLYARMSGEHSEVRFLSASLAAQNEFIDHHTWIDHQVGNTTSLQKYTTVLTEDGHGVFNGKVYIHRDAQKSAAEQNHRTLLLSKKAHIDTKPELLIEADDVKAKHGATVGQISQDELFYLQSRGIDEAQARQFLVQAFLSRLTEELPESLRSFFQQELKKLMANPGEPS